MSSLNLEAPFLFWLRTKSMKSHTRVYSVVSFLGFTHFTESFRVRLLAGANVNTCVSVCSCVSLCGRECARCSAGEMMDATSRNKL